MKRLNELTFKEVNEKVWRILAAGTLVCIAAVSYLYELKMVRGDGKRAAVLESIPAAVAGAVVAYLLARWQLSNEKRTRAAINGKLIKLVATELSRNQRSCKRISEYLSGPMNDPQRWCYIMGEIVRISDKRYSLYLTNGIDEADETTIVLLETSYVSILTSVEKLKNAYYILERRGYNRQVGVQPFIDEASDALNRTIELFTDESYQAFFRRQVYSINKLI